MCLENIKKSILAKKQVQSKRIFFSPFSITNLKYWGNSEQIISKTLQILSDLSVGYGTVRKLVKLEEIGFLLSNHTAAHYPFLGVGVSVTEMRCRCVIKPCHSQGIYLNFYAPSTLTFIKENNLFLFSLNYFMLSKSSFSFILVLIFLY